MTPFVRTSVHHSVVDGREKVGVRQRLGYQTFSQHGEHSGRAARNEHADPDLLVSFQCLLEDERAGPIHE